VLTRVDPLPRLLEKVSEAFGLRSVAVLERATEERSGWRYVACVGAPDCLRPEDAEVDVEGSRPHRWCKSGTSSACLST
jgi:two-component system sensor histidine kinase KdpD